MRLAIWILGGLAVAAAGTFGGRKFYRRRQESKLLKACDDKVMDTRVPPEEGGADE